MLQNELTELDITCPMHLIIPYKRPDPKTGLPRKPRKVAMNMNSYRNWQGHQSNNYKQLFTESLREQLEGKKIKTPVEITMQVFKPTKRRLDKGNVYAVIAKFCYDAVSSYECWEDDNDNFIFTETILPTVHDKENPRVEVKIRSITNDNENE